MKTIELSYWDILILLSYLTILLVLGYRAFRRTDTDNEKDFLLGNRSLTLPALVATLVTTWYGGIMGIGEFSYLYGISTWVVFGLPYYLFAALFAFLLAGRIRQAGQFTMADLLYTHYGRKAGVTGSVFLLFMTSPAPYILMIALLLQVIFGWSVLFSLIIGTLFSTVYVYLGGFRSVTQTDKFQFVLIYIGFMLMLGYLISKHGGLFTLFANLPPEHLTWHGGNTTQYILVWFFLASWTFIDPGFHQRCAAAKDVRTARNGILVSIGFWFIFDFLTVITGLYAVVLLPDINPVLSYPLLADLVLPPVIKGLFLTALLAVIMSTIDSYSFLSAITFGRDIIWRNRQNATGKVNRYTRIGLLLTAVISILLCVYIPSVISLWYTIGSLFIPPMLLPMLAVYFPSIRLSPGPTLTVMLTSFFVSFFAFLWGQTHLVDGSPVYLFGVEPFFPGLVISFLIFGIGWLWQKTRWSSRL